MHLLYAREYKSREKEVQQELRAGLTVERRAQGTRDQNRGRGAGWV